MVNVNRASGILMHITSLPSKYGIGSFGKDAYDFVDFLVEAGQKYWQILPIGPTSYGDSPYSSFSTYAGNPYFIDLETLCKEGSLTSTECENCDWGGDTKKVDFGKMFASRYRVLHMAFLRERDKLDMSEFKEQNKNWLEDFSLYMALKFKFSLVAWQQWDDDIKKRVPQAMGKYKAELADEIEFFTYTQYKFFEQWGKLHAYANKSGVKIIGDIPIYVADDSADTWSNTELFEFDDDLNPIEVAGCPPDAFAATGQLWGNPIYKWDEHKKTGYAWWISRVAAAFKLYDVVRIDHFRGFESYYAIPFGNKTAEKGYWKKGPNIEIFEKLRDALGELNIIAENLGYLTPEVQEMLRKSGYPGMKVLQFAFDSREESDYLPHNYDQNCVVYPGTHDNDTLAGWFTYAPPDDIKFAKRYFHLTEEEGLNEGFIRQTMMTVANLAIVPIQDYLNIGREGRMNTPSTLGDNWEFRISEPLDLKLAQRILALTNLYKR